MSATTKTRRRNSKSNTIEWLHTRQKNSCIMHKPTFLQSGISIIKNLRYLLQSYRCTSYKNKFQSRCRKRNHNKRTIPVQLAGNKPVCESFSRLIANTFYVTAIKMF